MSLSNNLERMALQVRSKPVLTLCALLVMMLSVEAIFAREMSMSMGQHTAIRRLDCSVFCRKTGFSGYVGGCQCGFTLFANKRSHLHSKFFPSPPNKLIYPENSYANDDDIEDSEVRPNAKERQGGLGAR